MIADRLRSTDALGMRSSKVLADKVLPSGHLRIVVGHADGTETVTEYDNLVVTAGKNHIADQLSSAPGGAAMGWMATGTGAGAPALADTALTTELSRVALTSRTDATNVVTYVGDWAAGTGTGTLTEAGIFNAGAAGTMLARANISVTKGASDTLKITWTVTLG